jgi:hypothetical protein
MRLRIIGLAAAAVLLVPATGAGADDGTHVESIDAVVSGSFVQVSGTAHFEATLIDPVEFEGTGDALQPNVGADLTGAKVNRAVGSNNVTFTLEAADMPGGVGVPGVVYLWGLSVNGNDTGLFLMASTHGGFPVPCTPTAPCGSLMRNDPVAGGFLTVARLSGTVIANGVVSWTFSRTQIGADTGDTIGIGGLGTPNGTINGANEIVFCCAAVDDILIDEFKLPGASVQVGIASAGTPDNLVPLTVTATVPSNGSAGTFSGAVLPKPAEAGDYKVVAKACYSDGNCGLSSTTITV